MTYGCTNGTQSRVLPDDALLDTVERYTSRYFTEFINPRNGLARERANMEVHGGQAMAAARYWYRRKSLYWGEYGFYDGYSATAKWYPRRYLAIDQLTVAPMIENYRTGLLWRLFMSCPEIQEGLKVLDITYTSEN